MLRPWCLASGILCFSSVCMNHENMLCPSCIYVPHCVSNHFSLSGCYKGQIKSLSGCYKGQIKSLSGCYEGQIKKRPGQAHTSPNLALWLLQVLPRPSPSPLQALNTWCSNNSWLDCHCLHLNTVQSSVDVVIMCVCISATS